MSRRLWEGGDMKKSYGVGLLILFWPLFLWGQKVEVQEAVLENGMKLLMVERHESPTVACGWVARVGSVNESPGITGISHLFEHMMFKGTKTIGTKDYEKDKAILEQQDKVRKAMEAEYSLLRVKLRKGEISGSIYDPENATPRLRELKAELEKLYAQEKANIVKDELDQIYTREGASGLNAFTTNDQTAYFVTVPANKLELWFWLESDRLANPVFREFYSERDVVREERRMRVESTPIGKFEEQFEAMFWQSTPYHHPVVGWPADLESITREQAEAYFATYYAPNNITAVLVGDLQPEKALELAKRYFGRLPRGPQEPPEVISEEIEQLAEKRFLAEAETNPKVVIRIPAVPFGHRDQYALELAAALLNRRTGRLYKRLVEEKSIAVGEPFAGFRPMKYAGYFEVEAEVKEGVDPATVEQALWRELERLAQEPVGEKELQKVKNQALADAFRRLQSNFFLLLQLMLYDSFGDWRFINEAPKKLQAVTAQDIQAVCSQLFKKEKRNVAIYLRKVGTMEDPELQTFPAELRNRLKAQLARFNQVTDPEKLSQVLAQMEQMSAQAPAQMQEAFAYLKKKVQERLSQLQQGKED